MNRDEMQKYRDRLIKEKNSILDTIQDMNDNSLEYSQRDELSELSQIDNHPADMGTEMFDKERMYALLDNEKKAIHRIDDALERINRGTYGKCELCGKEIQRERLEGMPSALTCMDCESKQPDYNTYRLDRPVEEETLAPFGRYFMDNTHDPESEVGYNAEDTWQDVDKYNARTGIPRNYDELNDEIDSYGEAENDDGVVEFTDRISNQYYKEQLPD